MCAQSINKTIQVKVLFTEGCVNAPATAVHVKQAAAELGVPVEFKEVVVTSEEEAAARQLCGSPTVLIDGLDLEPASRAETGPIFT